MRGDEEYMVDDPDTFRLDLECHGCMGWGCLVVVIIVCVIVCAGLW